MIATKFSTLAKPHPHWNKCSVVKPPHGAVVNVRRPRGWFRRKQRLGRVSFEVTYAATATVPFSDEYISSEEWFSQVDRRKDRHLSITLSSVEQVQSNDEWQFIRGT